MLLISVPITSSSLESIVSGHIDIVPLRELFVNWFTKLHIYNGWVDPIHVSKSIAVTTVNSQAIANGQSYELSIQDFLKTFLIADWIASNTWVIISLEK